MKRKIFSILALLILSLLLGFGPKAEADTSTPAGGYTLHLPLLQNGFRPIAKLSLDPQHSQPACAAIANPGETLIVEWRAANLAYVHTAETVIIYDANVLSLTAVETGGFLPGATAEHDPLPDTDGQLHLSLSTPSTGNGSGTLARFTFTAVTTGTTDLAMATPLLTDPNGLPRYDFDGDTFFDGTLSLARVSVRTPCDQFANLLFIAFRDGADQDAIAQANGLHLIAPVEPLTATFTAEITSGLTVEATILGLLADPLVHYAEPIVLSSTDDHETHPNDPEYTSPRAHQWDKINVGQTVNAQQGLIDSDEDGPEGWDMLTDCRGPNAGNPHVIAILDTGIDLTNPDLAANLWTNPLNGAPNDVLPAVDDVHGASFSHAGGGVTSITANLNDLKGHGSAVASTIGAVGNNGRELAGVCWQASLLTAQTDFAQTSTSTALSYLIHLKSRGVDIRVVNGSFSGTIHSQTMYHLLNLLRAQGVLYVATAGNTGGAHESTGEATYQDVDGNNTVSNGDIRRTDVGIPPQHYRAGSTVNCPGDLDCTRPLTAFAANEKHADPDGDHQFDQGEKVYRDANNNNLADYGDTRLSEVHGFHPVFGNTQYPSDSIVRCYPSPYLILSDLDCWTSLVPFAANEKHHNNPDGVPGLDPQILRYPCAYNLDNIICVGATDNRDNLAGFTNTGGQVVDLFAPGVNIRVLDVLGAATEMYVDADGSMTVSAGDTRIYQTRSGNQTYAAGSVVAGGDNDEGSPLRPYPANVKHDENLGGTANQYDRNEYLYRDNDGNDRVSHNDTRLMGMNFGPGNKYDAHSSVRCPGDADCDNDLAAFQVTEMHNTTRFINGTSFSAPNTTGVAALCWSLMPDRPYTQIRDLLFRFVDRKPAFEGHAATGGRLRWPCGGDMGDAPPSYMTVAKEGSTTPDLLLCANQDNGPTHLDYTNEWFGADVTQEHNANTPGKLDMDGAGNLGPGNLANCPTGTPNSDGNDDGNFSFNPPPPWQPGTLVTVNFDVCSDLLMNGGQFTDSSGGRYDPNTPDKWVYTTVWFDWGKDGSFAGDYTPLLPMDFLPELFVPANQTPVVPPPGECKNITRLFFAQSDLPPWFRFRLDYGEYKGNNDPLPLFAKDKYLAVSNQTQIAIYGEVEDYPLAHFVPPPVKVSTPPTIVPPNTVVTYTLIVPVNPSVTGPATVLITDTLPLEVVFDPTTEIYCNVGECFYDFEQNAIRYVGIDLVPETIVVVRFPVVVVPPSVPPPCPPQVINRANVYDGAATLTIEAINPIACGP